MSLTVLSLLLALVVGSTQPATANPPAPDSLFVGTWRLVSTEITSKDGTKGPMALLGSQGQAYLIYTPDHHMCAVLMNPQRSMWSSRVTPTEKDAKNAVDGFYAYCGTFKVNTEEGSVTHHLELALSPNDVGQDLKRSYTFQGDRLILRPVETDSAFSGGSLTWERVR